MRRRSCLHRSLSELRSNFFNNMDTWYHSKKMTYGAAVLFVILVYVVIQFVSLMPAVRQRGMSAEVILFSLTCYCALSVLYYARVPTLRKWGLALGVAAFYAAGMGLYIHFVPELPPPPPPVEADTLTSDNA